MYREFIVLHRSISASASASLSASASEVYREFSGEFQMAKRQRKESEKNLLVKYDPHRDHLVQQYKTVLVRHGNGKATPDDADFTVVAEATYGTIHASPTSTTTRYWRHSRRSPRTTFSSSRRPWAASGGASPVGRASARRPCFGRTSRRRLRRRPRTRRPPARASFRARALSSGVCVGGGRWWLQAPVLHRN